MSLKESVLMDGHEWIRADVVVRMEAELLAEMVLLRKIAQAVWSNRNQLANRYLGPGAAQRMPDEIDTWLEEWFMVREKNAPTFQALAPDSPSFDPELELLNRLGRMFPEEALRFVNGGPVQHDYAEHEDVLSQGRGAVPPLQSRLGFLNQSRRVRGFPLIVMHRTFEDRDPATGGVYFEPWTGPGDPPKGTYK